MSTRPFPLPLKPLLMRCDTFTNALDQYETTTIIVVPTRIVQNGNTWIITWRCSKGDSCRNENCTYSRKNRSKGEL